MAPISIKITLSKSIIAKGNWSGKTLFKLTAIEILGFRLTVHHCTQRNKISYQQSKSILEALLSQMKSYSNNSKITNYSIRYLK